MTTQARASEVSYRGVLIKWTVATGVSWAVAVISLQLEYSLEEYGLNPLSYLLLVVSVGQWFVLRQYIPRASWWMAAALAGLVFAAVIELAAETEIVQATLVLVALAPVVLLQAIILAGSRATDDGEGARYCIAEWIVANIVAVLALVASILLTLVMVGVATNDFPPYSGVLIFVAVIGVVFGFVSGLFMAHILCRTAEQPPLHFPPSTPTHV